MTRSLASALAFSLMVMACGAGRSAERSSSLESGKGQRCTSELVVNRKARGAILAPACGAKFGSDIQYQVEEPIIGYWRPTPAQIATLEERLHPALELGRASAESLVEMPADEERRAEDSWGVRAAIEDILKHFAQFRRQYIGIVVRGGSRRVLVNMFPEADEPRAWTERWVDDMTDGGPSYWRIQYDVLSRRFLGFNVNPSA